MSLTADADGVIVACPSCGQKNRLAFGNLARRGQCGKCHTPLPPPAEPVEVTSTATFDTLVKESSLPVLVDFWAPWCGPCHMVAPELQKVARNHAGAWLVVKVNTDALPDLSARYTIRSIPTMMTFSGGQQRHRVSGALPEAGIEEMMKA